MSSSSTEPEGPRDFNTTHWSIVAQAAQQGDTSNLSALDRLCENYWHPLYFYVRRKGNNPSDAQDIIQGFFAKLIEKNYLQAADPTKGPFRAFLKMAIKRYMANEWAKAAAQKRGGGQTVLSLDFYEADRQFASLPESEASVEMSFDREWAESILDRVFQSLASSYQSRNKDDWYTFLRTTLPDQTQEMTYNEAATQFDCSLNTVKSEAHRFRKRFQSLLRDTVMETVTNEVDLEEEIRHLIQVLGE